MSNHVLHILNGDATKFLFDQTDIPGDVSIMRETLCMGPISESLNSAFWNNRKDWFYTNYFVDNSTYDLQIKKEVDRITDDYDELIIWYEYDVFCQINMLFLVNWAIQHRSKAKIRLVYSSVGLGRLSSAEYLSLLQKSFILDPVERKICEDSWKAISKKDWALLDASIKSKNLTLSNLSNALRAYYGQVLGNQDFKPVHLRIKDIIRSGTTYGRAIISALLQRDAIYGYGDLQYAIVLMSMSDSFNLPLISASDMEEYIEAVFSAEFHLN